MLIIDGRRVFVGCCGFPVSRRKYYELFDVVELQNTFYNLPSIEWAKKVRDEAPADFVFTVKAWQVITHPPRSPTWRRLRKRPPGNIDNYGWLKPTRENIEAFRQVVKVALILNAPVIVIQTPPSMPYTEESIKWIDEFFSIITKEVSEYQILVGWEPRGPWKSEEARRIIAGFLKKYPVLIHITDLLREEPVDVRSILYTRLHGKGGKEVNYKYKYTEDDLVALYKIIARYNVDSYILFNNIYMKDNALQFKELIKKKI